MKVVLMAGGKGTRMESFAPNLPKSMIPLCGKPIIQHQLESLVQNNLNDIIIIIGHLGSQIKEFVSDGSKFGCNVSYYEESTPLGSGGALFKVFDLLDDDFILINGDLIFSLDFSRFIGFYHEKKAWAALAVHPNSHPFDSALIVTDKDNKITNWLNKEEKREYYQNLVNAGIHIFSKKFLSSLNPISEKVDLDREMIKPQISSGKFFAYHTPEYIKDAGTPERFNQVKNDLESGIVKNRNLTLKQRAVFLDRDGTINKSAGFINKHENLELIPGVADAIARINKTGYLAIVITNQPVIARGECTLEELKAIHNKMEKDLGKSGAFIDDLFYCPHHPDKGFPGEIVDLKINCNCRKPRPGMIFSAAEKFNIDLSSSYMVGDQISDVKTAIASGCIPVMLGEDADNSLNENKEVLHFPSLSDFVASCLS